MAVERTNRDIRSLVHQISAGEIKLPEIQRGYVWKATQVAKLVESLYRGYPTGSLLLWKTSEASETRGAALGREQGFPSAAPLYLLDGQQRLTSLYRVFNNHPAAQIVFNIETEAFQNQSAATRQNRKWVKVYDVVGPDADTFGIYGQLRTANLAITDVEIGERLKDLEKISSRDFHMEVLHGFNSEEVAEIFVRVNSGGRALKTTDLALATLTSRSPGFLAWLEDEAAEWADRGFGKLDVNFLIKALTLTLRISGKRASSVSTLTAADPSGVAAAWEQVKRGLRTVVSLLQEQLLVPSSAVMPSLAALHPMIVYYGRRSTHALPDAEVDKGFLYWFMVVTATNRYGGATDSTLSQDIKVLDDEQPIRSLLANAGLFEFGCTVTPRDLAGRNIQSPYVMLSYLASAHAGGCDWWDGSPISVAAEGSDRPQYCLLFPASKLRAHRNNYTTAEINDIANIVFVSAKTTTYMIGDNAPADYRSDVISPDWIAHALPESPEILGFDRYRDFLVARRDLLAHRMTALLDSFRPDFLVGGTPSGALSRSLQLTGFSAGTRTALVAEAVLDRATWAGHIDTAELDAALDAAASGIVSDVTVGGIAVPVSVDEDGVSLPVGPFLVRGSISQWHGYLEQVFTEALPIAECPVLEELPWDGALHALAISDAI